MLQFVLRALGLAVLALAVVLAVLDITRSITASQVVLTPLGETWATVQPAAGDIVAGFDNAPLGQLWAPLARAFLTVPSWLVFWLVAMLLLWSGERRTRRLGRFSSH